MKLKTVDEVMQMIDIISTPGADAFYGGDLWEEIRAELEKWRKEIDRLSKSLKLQQEVSNELARQNTELRKEIAGLKVDL